MTQESTSTNPSSHLIVIAGATGDLGGRIVHHLKARDTPVKALVRAKSDKKDIESLKKLGATVVEVDYENPNELAKACAGAICFVSALSGLRNVIVDLQRKLLHAAVSAGVPRFIPSDFAIDFTKLPYGNNRNLDYRKEFHAIIKNSPIRATSVLNGMFADLLVGAAPFVIFPINRVLCWGPKNQKMDFTTIENTAEYTAAAALDGDAPRYLRIAGAVQDSYELCRAASEATGSSFRILKPGGIGTLNRLIDITRLFSPAEDEIFPPWQGMQYMRDMFAGNAKLTPLDNDRYPEIKWTSVAEVLKRKR